MTALVNYKTILAKQVDLYVYWILNKTRSYSVSEYEKKQLKALIQNQLEKSADSRKLASELGNFFKFWTIDWNWVAFHITQDYYSQKRLFELIAFLKRDPNQVLIFKILDKSSCEKSRKMYLTNHSDFNSKPKVFSLFELLQNGSNLCKEQHELKPVLGVTDFGTYKDKYDEVHLIYDKYQIEIKDYPEDIWDYNKQKFIANKEQQKHLKNVSKFIKTEIKKGNGDLTSKMEPNSIIYVNIDAKGLKNYYSKKKNNTTLLKRIISLFK